MGDNLLASMGEGLSHLLYPRLCEGCSKPLLAEEDILCLDCNVYYLPRTAYHHIAENETAMRFAGRFPFEKATSLAYFTPEGLLQHLLHRLKYEERKDIGLYLGRQLGYDLQQLNWAEGIDGIVPVPLHKEKERSRGFNQAQLIAEGMGEALHIPVITDAIVRTRNTESQTKKSRAERLENMQSAFAIQNHYYENKQFLLVDDVLTTGATLEACALELLKIPGIKLSIATIGIAGS